mmetsp:Transcript_37745/g.94605  ORF Transcript_37745/g.94605 Transcript_37745/m.94605 type:complete len:145 (-) Transcript_37745:174-608(-)
MNAKLSMVVDGNLGSGGMQRGFKIPRLPRTDGPWTAGAGAGASLHRDGGLPMLEPLGTSLHNASPHIFLAQGGAEVCENNDAKASGSAPPPAVGAVHEEEGSAPDADGGGSPPPVDMTDEEANVFVMGFFAGEARVQCARSAGL